MAVRLRPRAVTGLVVALILIALLILWSQRQPIATNIIARELERRGVAGRYRVSAIGLRTQVIEDVSIGDPTRPDLTARRAEVTLYYGLTGVGVSSIVAEGVRLRGRLVDGTVTFGAVDKLLPAPSGAPFALPDFAAEIRDTQVLLETPYGVFANRIEGSGKLSDGFRGRLRSDGRGLAIGGCAADEVHADLTLTVADRKPHVAGPVMAPAFRCGGTLVRSPFLGIDATLIPTLDGGQGTVRLDTPGIVAGSLSTGRTAGQMSFAGTTQRAEGGIALAAEPVRTPQGEAKRASVTGRWALRGTAADLTGAVELKSARLAKSTTAPIAETLQAAAGTPVGPIGTALARALTAAASDLSGRADIAVTHRDSGTVARLTGADLRAASGARITAGEGGGLNYDAATGKTQGGLTIRTAGGGMPQATVMLGQAQPGGAIEGTIAMEPYVVPGGQLALEPLRFAATNGTISRFGTVVMLDGPLADGRVSGLRVALSGRVSGAGTMLIGEGCQPAAFRTLEIAGARLENARLRLCPLFGGALVGISRTGAIGGGIRIDRPRLAGAMGGSPLTIAADRLDVPLKTPGFTAQALAVRLGTGDDPTRLDIASARGDVTEAGIAGTFEGAAGKIGNVPLVVSEGKGDWSLAGADLSMSGSLAVEDAEADAPRFRRLLSDDFTLALKAGTMSATGHLKEPKTGFAISGVDIVHRFGDGTGTAVLDVPGLGFSKRLQPEMLTPLTTGIIANVEGIVHGRGEIRWDAKGVTSDGAFTTERIDLAAAFGPVKGLAGTITFSDLLGMVTPPGQTVTIAEVNPGVAVADGVIRYQLLPDFLVKIEGGRWPFAGGDLALDETTLDFGEKAQRRMVFHVAGLDAGKFIQQLEFENIAATGLFDGSLPMIFDKDGGRIVGGKLTARPGGGTLAYVGEVSNAQLGTFGKMAFDALKAIRYSNLTIELGGPLDGEIVSKVNFNGVNREPLGGAALNAFSKQLVGLPFRFNITIKAPFRGLVNTASTFADPTSLVRGTLPADGTDVQKQESEGVR